MRYSDKSIGFTAFLVLAIIFGFLILSPDTEDEAQKPICKAHISLQKPSVKIPDVSYAFEVKANRAKAEVVLGEYTNLKKIMDHVLLPTTEVKKTSLGKYYITGYTSWELGGSTMTASGKTCHKAESIEDSLYNPTTCAVDPSLHDFSDLFFIEGFGYYIAEDTGSAIIGKHLDLFYGWSYEDNQEALTITGYYTVYAVEIEYGYQQASYYDVRDLVWKEVSGIGD